MCDIQNNGKIQREFETRSTDDQPTIQWLPVVGSWTFLGVNMHFNEKLFMCDSCNFLVRAWGELVTTITSPSCWGTHFLYLSNLPSGNLLPIIPWTGVLVSIVSQCEAKLRVVDGWVVHSVQMQCSGDNTVTVTHSPTLHRAWLGSQYGTR